MILRSVLVSLLGLVMTACGAQSSDPFEGGTWIELTLDVDDK